MENEVRVRYLIMPSGIRGFTIKEDACSYDVYINPNYTHESQMETLEHELAHIENGDFDTEWNVNELEMMR